MRPQPFSFMAGKTRRQSTKGAVRLTATVRVHRSVGRSSMATDPPFGSAMPPALFTRISIPPRLAVMSSTSAVIAASSVTLAT